MAHSGPGRRRPCTSPAARPQPARTTAPPPGKPDGGAVLIRRSEGGDVRRLRALLALLDVERDALAFIERAVPAGLDGRVVDEDVRAATIGGGEAKTLLGVEPLHCSFGHCSLLAEVVHRGSANAQSLPDTDNPSGTCPVAGGRTSNTA